MSEMKLVKPFPHVFCEACFFNGCYPWNMNPLLCYMEFGGIFPQMFQYDEVFHEIVSCLSYKMVTEENWLDQLSEMKKSASENEKLRSKARDGETRTNQTLPEHLFIKEEVK